MPSSAMVNNTALAIAGMLLLLSWIGWGHLLQRALRIRFHPGWAALAAWGAALLIAVGGILNALTLVSPILLCTIAFFGAIAGIAYALPRCRNTWRSFRTHWRFLLPPLLLGLALYAVAIASTSANPGDDLESYRVFPKQMLESGTLLDPFSIRRMATYGGHAFLQAQFLATAKLLDASPNILLTHGHAIDSGLCMLLIAGLLWQLLRPRTDLHRLLAQLAAIAVFLLPLARANTHSQASGLLFFLALAQLLHLLGRRNILPIAILTALLAAAAATLRTNFLPGAAITLALAALRAASPRHLPLSRKLLTVALPLLLMLLPLLPWAILLQRSSHTPLYPLLPGNASPAFLSQPLPLLSHLRWAALSLLYPPEWLLLFALPFAFHFRRWRDALPLYAGGLLMTFTVAWGFTNQDTSNFYRLTSPMLLACALYSIVILFRRWKRTPIRLRWAALLLLASILSAGAYPFSDAFRHSYSALVLPLFLAAAWLQMGRSPIAKWTSGLALFALTLWTAITTRSRLADNGIVFFDATAFFLCCWTTLFSHPPLARLLAAIGAAATGAICVLGWSHISGPAFVALCVSLALAVAILGYLAWRPFPRRHLLVIAILVALAVLIYINLNPLMDAFAAWICLAAIAGAAWLAWHAVSAPLRIAATVSLTIATFAAVPIIPSVYHYPAGLALMALCVAAALLASRMHAHCLWLIAPLALGSLLLLLPEIRAWSNTCRSGDLFREPPDTTPLYAAAQNATPPDAGLFTWTIDPARFNFARNTIAVPDFAGAFASPPPPPGGLAAQATPDQLRTYLLAHHLRYLVLSKDRILHLPTNNPRLQHELVQLQLHYPHTYNSPDLVVIDLAP